MALYYKSNNNWTEFAPNPYPIGTLVMNKDVDTSPATLVGGTWEKWDNIVEGNYTLNHSELNITNFQIDLTGFCSGTLNISKMFKINVYYNTENLYITFGKDFFPPTDITETNGYRRISDTKLEVEISASHTATGDYYLYIDSTGKMTCKVDSNSVGDSVWFYQQTVNFGYYTTIVNPFGDFYNYKRIA